MKVVLLHDDVPPTARQDELDVLVQAQAVEAALAELGHTFARLPLTLNLGAARAALLSLQPDVVFNVVESVGGQGRLIHLGPALLDAMDLPYTGAPTEAMFLTSNKLLAKQILHAQGLATPAWVTTVSSGGPPWHLTGRCIFKSVWEHASVGLTEDALQPVTDLAGLRGKVAERGDRLRGEVFAEAFIDGREFNLSLLAGAGGVEVLPPAEIHFVDYPPGKPRVVDYRAKWDSESFEFHHTPRGFDFPPADAGLLDELRRLACRCWEVFGLRGYARVDFRVDPSGRPWILEINTNPCLSPDAGFAAATARGGLSFAQVVARVLADAQGGRAAAGSKSA